MHTARVRNTSALSFVLVSLLFFATGAQAQRSYVLSGPSRALKYEVPNGLILPLANPPGVSGTAQQTGSNPATLSLPPNVFAQSPAPKFIVPINTPPAFVQFATHNYIQSGPTATATFKAGPKTSRPTNFGFCPGAAANPACTNPASGGTQGTRAGLITYSAGPNQFGGTMTALFGGGAETSEIIAVSPTQRIRHSPLNLNLINGQGYNIKSSGTGPSAQVTTGGVISSGGIITQPGNVTSTVPGFLRTTTGFPFTTGMVVVKVPKNPPTTPDSTFSATGYDTRTALGSGRIQMVAGALGNSSINGEFGTMMTITMRLVGVGVVPSMSRIGAATLATLLVAAAFLARRRL